jgi:hypothetical protein
MNELERYLDQVCRSIGGPRSLRQHVRQELREHLLDAVAQHKAAGLPEAEAVARALEEFGKPEEVRSELEATHGHSLMAVVIDKAMQWKELTMKAKWLWTSWAYLGLVVVIALEVLFVSFAVLFIVPKFNQLLRDGLIDPAILSEQGVSWMPAYLNGLNSMGEKYTLIGVLLAGVAWGLFEWRVRSENKPFMRLSALGTVAVALMVVVCITAAALLISFCLGAPATSQLARQFAKDQIAHIDTSVAALEQALVQKDWKKMENHLNRAYEAFDNLAKAAPALPALIKRNDPQKLEELRAQTKAARDSLAEVQQSIRDKDSGRLETALQKFRQQFSRVREATQDGEVKLSNG